MANIRTNARSFGGGEVTPEFWGRVDDAKYQTGLATCRNFIVQPHGPVSNRPGTEYVREVKTSSRKTRLIPFVYNNDQTMVLELGHEYLRFHTQGGTLTPGTVTAWNSATAYSIGNLASRSGVNYYCTAAHTNQQPPNSAYWYAMPSGVYEIPTPYVEADLFDIHYVQSADVLTLVHTSYLPRELRRLGATNWTLSSIAFASRLSPPGSVTATAHAGATPGTPTTWEYVVTALGENGLDESTYSATASCSNNLFDDGAYNTIAWSAVTGAIRYNVYKYSNGLYGFIGQTASTSFNDNNIAADVAATPPEIVDPFLGTNNYPGAVSYFEQRRCFGGTNNQPQTLWMTKSGTESNLNYSIPTRDDDSIQFRVAAREANQIRHIVPLTNLILLTAAAEWRVTSVNSDAITPSTVSVRPQSYIGANKVQPVIVNNNLIFSSARGGHLRELAYNWQASGYITGDLSLRAPHLFDGYDVVDMAYAKSPLPIVWAVSTSGRLLGLTYVPEQQIGAWHWHDTDGLFESCTVVAEGQEDILYVVVKRTIDGATKRYVERMRPKLFGDPEDAFFVDCGDTYDGLPVTIITGLGWLEGKTVNILADGAVHPQRTVTSGQVHLDYEASKVQIGLPINADIQTLPLAFETMGYGQGRRKNVNKVWLRVYKSSGIFVGPDLDNLTEAKQRTTEPYGSPPEYKSEEIEVVVQPNWTDGGQVYVRQRDPLPLTIVSMTLQVAIGD